MSTVKKVEINNLGIKAHQVHAENESKTELKYLAKYLPFLNPAEILGTTSIYVSQFEALFEISQFSPWAAFLPPKKFDCKSPRRVFGFKVLPEVKMDDETIILRHGSKEDENDEEDRKRLFDLFALVKDLDTMAQEANNQTHRFQKG